MNAIIQVFGCCDDRYQALRTIWMIDVFFRFQQRYVNIVLVKGKRITGALFKV